MTRNTLRRTLALCLLLALCLPMAGCKLQPESGETRVLLDGKVWAGGSLNPEADDDLRVYVTLDGALLIDLPFSEAHTVDVLLADGGENHVVLTGQSAYMQSANCENQDCVDMGAVTRENLELRVLGGFIVCLPHRVSVEVRGE